MTKWQESCITALATSPLTWSAFKLEQRNRKLLDQYIGRIWPYQGKKKEVKKRGHTIQCKTIKDAIRAIQENEENKEMRVNISACTSIRTIRKLALTKEVRLTEKEQYQIARSDAYCTLSYMFSKDNKHVYSDYFGYDGEDSVKLLDNWRRKITHMPIGTKLQIVTMHFNQEASYIELKKRILIHDLKQLARFEEYNTATMHPKRKQNQRKDLNVGIEIEYTGQETSKIVKNRILGLNCISFDSGFDGNMKDRLRENRIRLDGHRGLKGLWVLLEDMKKTSHLDENSSVHMHIDCKYDDSFALKIAPVDTYRSIISKLFTPSTGLNEQGAEDWFKAIFGAESKGISQMFCGSKVRFKSEFETLEYRFCNVNLNYSDYVIQILALIHLTECLKTRTTINASYMKMLYKIQKKLIGDTGADGVPEKTVTTDRRATESCIAVNTSTSNGWDQVRIEAAASNIRAAMNWVQVAE